MLSQTCIITYVNYLLFLSDFNLPWCVFSADFFFFKSSNIKFYEILLVWVDLFHADGPIQRQTDRQAYKQTLYANSGLSQFSECAQNFILKVREWWCWRDSSSVRWETVRTPWWMFGLRKADNFLTNWPSADSKNTLHRNVRYNLFSSKLLPYIVVCGPTAVAGVAQTV